MYTVYIWLNGQRIEVKGELDQTLAEAIKNQKMVK